MKSFLASLIVVTLLITTLLSASMCARGGISFLTFIIYVGAVGATVSYIHRNFVK